MFPRPREPQGAEASPSLCFVPLLHRATPVCGCTRQYIIMLGLEGRSLGAVTWGLPNWLPNWPISAPPMCPQVWIVHGHEESVPLGAVRAMLAADYLQLVDPDRVSNPHGWVGGWARLAVTSQAASASAPHLPEHVAAGWRQLLPLCWAKGPSKRGWAFSASRGTVLCPSPEVLKPAWLGNLPAGSTHWRRTGCWTRQQQRRPQQRQQGRLRHTEEARRQKLRGQSRLECWLQQVSSSPVFVEAGVGCDTHCPTC